jgi:hypothetical protein
VIHREHCDVISLLVFFQNKESRQKIILRVSFPWFDNSILFCCLDSSCATRILAYHDANLCSNGSKLLVYPFELLLLCLDVSKSNHCKCFTVCFTIIRSGFVTGRDLNVPTLVTCPSSDISSNRAQSSLPFLKAVSTFRV